MKGQFMNRLLLMGIIIILISTEAYSQDFQLGIYNPTGNKLEVRAKSISTYTSIPFTDIIFTIRWPSSYGITLGAITTSYGIAKSFGQQSPGDGYTYQIFAGTSGPIVTFNSGTEYPLVLVSVTAGTGTGTFELITGTTWTAANNADIYFEMNLAEVENPSTPFYQSSISSVALPVELASFTSSVNNLNADLKWSTATEVNNYGFDVERRTVSSQPSAVSTWQKVGFVNGNGTSNVQHSYSFSDNITVSGTYAYRLKQIDNGGAFKYSQETEVTIEVPKVFTLSQNYPNPFNPTTNIDFTVAADGKASLKVYNTLGQEVAELFSGEAQAGRIIQTHFNASGLASGIYFSRLEADGKSLVKRMMFVK
jgi:hypothetical protein